MIIQGPFVPLLLDCTGADDDRAANGQPAAGGVMSVLASRLNALAAAIPRVHFHAVTRQSNSDTCGPAATERAIVRHTYWDQWANGKALVVRGLALPDQGKQTGLGKLDLEAESTTTTNLRAGLNVAGDRVLPYRCLPFAMRQAQSSLLSDLMSVRVDELDARGLLLVCFDEPLGTLDTDTDTAVAGSFISGTPIETTDLEQLRAVYDTILQNHRKNVVAFQAVYPDNTPLVVTTTAANFINLVSGVAPDNTYGATGAGFPTWTRACARGLAANATLYVSVRARMTGATDTGTVRFETQAANGGSATNLTVTGSTWTTYTGTILAKADGTGSVAEAGDWLQMRAQRSGSTDSLELQRVDVHLTSTT